MTRRTAERPCRPRLAEWIGQVVSEVLALDHRLERLDGSPLLLEGSNREAGSASIYRLSRYEPPEEPPLFEPNTRNVRPVSLPLAGDSPLEEAEGSDRNLLR